MTTQLYDLNFFGLQRKLPVVRGFGSGQTSQYIKGSVLASDSFFPFDDSVKTAAKYGVGAIIQQGGSIRDKDSIMAADRANIPMVFTGRRAFWH